MEKYEINSFLMMASVGSTAEVNVIAQLDRIPGYSARFGDWTDCKRFNVTAGMTPTAANAVLSLGEINMGDPTNLADFIIWGINEYPADKYALVLSDHGDNSGVCIDYTNDYDYLTLVELTDALQSAYESTGVQIDLVGFEACIMGAVEVAYHCRDYADVMVASEEICFDWPYDDILAELVATPTMDSATLGYEVVQLYKLFHWHLRTRASLSAYNLTVIDDVIHAINSLASGLNHTVTTYCYDILEAMSETDFADVDYYYAGDLYHFAQNLLTVIPDPGIRIAAQNVIDAIANALINEWHGSAHPNFHGLSIYLPPSEAAYNARTPLYSLEALYWIQNTTWDDFLYTLFVTYAPGIRSQESLSDVSYTFFDSNADDHLDSVQVHFDTDTTDPPQNVSVQALLNDPLNNTVDTDSVWALASDSDEWCDLNLTMQVEGVEGWYDVELLLYDEYGILEDALCSVDLVYLPQEMEHNVAVDEILVLKTIVGEGHPAKLNVTLENTGHYPETLNVTILGNSTLIDTIQPFVPSFSNTTLTILWNTTGSIKGNYAVKVVVDPVEGETNTTDNSLTAPIGLYLTIPGDVDGDRDVDIYDIVRMAGVYSVSKPDPQYNANCDIDNDGDIDIYDIVIAANNYGESW